MIYAFATPYIGRQVSQVGCRKLLAIGFVGWGVAYLIFGPSPPVVMMLEGVGVKTSRIWVWVSLGLSSLVYGQGVALTLIPLVPLIKSGATMEAERRGMALEGEAALAAWPRPGLAWPRAWLPCARRPTTDDRRPLAATVAVRPYLKPHRIPSHHRVYVHPRDLHQARSAAKL